MGKTLKETKMGHPDYDKCQEHWQQVKMLRNRIKADEMVATLTSTLRETKDQLQAQETIISTILGSQQLALFPYEDKGEFLHVDKMKFKKFKKARRNKKLTY